MYFSPHEAVGEKNKEKGHNAFSFPRGAGERKQGNKKYVYFISIKGV